MNKEKYGLDRETIGYSMHPGENRFSSYKRVGIILNKHGFLRRVYLDNSWEEDGGEEDEEDEDKESYLKEESSNNENCKRAYPSVSNTLPEYDCFEDENSGLDGDPILISSEKYSRLNNFETVDAVHRYIHPRVDDNLKIIPGRGKLWTPNVFDSKRSKKTLDGVIELCHMPLSVRNEILRDLRLSLEEVSDIRYFDGQKDSTKKGIVKIASTKFFSFLYGFRK